MDFKKFKDSAFLHLGHSRFDYSDGNKFLQRPTVLFETSTFFRFSQNEVDRFSESEYRPGGFDKSLTLSHLKKALLINDPLFLDFEFKKEIARQWLEVSTIIDKLDNQPRFSMLLINEPGVIIPKHSHIFKQTLTFCYTFQEEKANVFDNSCFILGENGERQVNLPDSDKFYFTFLDHLPHEVRSNEWRFFWFHDYSDYTDIPKESDIDFTYLPI